MIEPLGVLAILAMGATAFLMRAGGFWLMGHVTVTPRVRRMLEALPGSIVAAIVLPVIAKIGPVAALAVVAAAAVMILRRNEFLSVIVGVLVGVALRAAGM
jgi:branched chain amino acid efflux pump